MTDEERKMRLIERLRLFVNAVEGAVWIFEPGTTPIMLEAADAIQSLQAQVKALEGLVYQYIDPYNVAPSDQTLVDDIQARAALGDKA